MNKENLQRMADHIRTIPQEMFGMGAYRTGDSTTAECGSVGCAIGHCIILDDKEPPRFTSGDINFIDWEESFTGLGLDLYDRYNESNFMWDWCFSAVWEETDNTPEGAALRIEWLLAHGLPEDWAKQMHGLVELCYTA